jgi:hypothetical protein
MNDSRAAFYRVVGGVLFALVPGVSFAAAPVRALLPAAGAAMAPGFANGGARARPAPRAGQPDAGPEYAASFRVWEKEQGKPGRLLAGPRVRYAGGQTAVMQVRDGALHLEMSIHTTAGDRPALHNAKVRIGEVKDGRPLEFRAAPVLALAGDGTARVRCATPAGGEWEIDVTVARVK